MERSHPGEKMYSEQENRRKNFKKNRRKKEENTNTNKQLDE
jgi:hypothetical protein